MTGTSPVWLPRGLHNRKSDSVHTSFLNKLQLKKYMVKDMQEDTKGDGKESQIRSEQANA
jgi:hypothetical protein